MSIQVMQAVWQHSQSVGRARIVLLAIADHQGEIGAWPSIQTLARMANASERSVQRDIQYLQDIGELVVQVQNAPTKNQYKSNLYWVNLPGVTELQSGVTNATSGVTDLTSGVTAGGVLTLIEPLKEPVNAHSHLEELFNEFWTAYPRKIDKAKAFRAFKSALKRTKFEDILAGVIAYRNDPKRDPEFTKFPATWLNNDAWENAASVPEQYVSQRREKEIEHSKKLLQEIQESELKAKPAPKCEHGNNVALCKICIRN